MPPLTTIPYLPKVIPILPLPPNTVLLPGLVHRIQSNRKDVANLFTKLYKKDRDGDHVVGCVPFKTSDGASGEVADLYEYGCAARVVRIERVVGGGFLCVVEGMSRFHIEKVSQITPFIEADVSHYMEQPIQPADLASHTLLAQLKQLSKELVSIIRGLKLPGIILKRLETFIQRADAEDAGALADLMAGTVESTFDEKLGILKAYEIKDRLEKAVELLNRQLNVVKISRKISTTVEGKLSKKQREFYLKQQLDAIREELGEKDGEGSEDDEIAELKKRLEAAGLTPEADKVAQKELRRLKRMHPTQAEYQVCRTYLENIADIPWSKEEGTDVATSDAGLVDRARAQLNADHYGLEKVKKRLLEYLAVLRLKKQADAGSVDKGPIILLAGPPGVGKTSLAKSVATALGRKFHRISLGGVRDEAEIRGHRRTYVGAMPGLIVQGLKKAGVVNPVFLLDEIDKISGNNFHGDPSAAMLEVLDPEQNHTFNDHYVNIPIDLSKVLFIATANNIENIPAPLLDRMELINLPGYTFLEKKHIADQYLIPKQLKTNGLSYGQVTMADDVILKVATAYTREAGVRNLEREIASVCRYKAVQYAEYKDKQHLSEYNPIVNIDDLEKILGIEKFQDELAERSVRPGVVTGIAYMGSGNGGLLFIEASEMPGKGNLQLTGKLGDVIKESAMLALSWVKAHAFVLGLTMSPHENVVKDRDIHIHCPAGAIPKDGPSAGIAMTLALVSLLAQRKVPPTLSMTGEITLRGQVLPIGGVKEKVLAAHRAGIKTVIIPARNKKDVITDLPEDVRSEVRFHYAHNMWDVLSEVWPGVYKDELAIESRL